MKRRAWLPVVGLALAAVFQATGLVLAQGETVSAEDFLARLRRAESLAELDGAAPSPARMEQVRDALGLPLDVDLGGWGLQVERDPVLQELSGETAEDFERAANRLRVLEGALEDAGQRQVPTADEVADALRGAYRSIAPTAPNPLDAILRGAADLIRALLDRLVSLLGGAGSGLAWIALAVVGAAAVVLLLRNFRLLPERILPDADGRRGGPERTDWATRADEAIRAGDLTEAVRALYLSLVVNLARAGLVADAPALTAGETRAAVARRRPALLPAVVRATDAYERVVYGGDTADERDLGHLREAAGLTRTT